ncbi:hypothetical protein NC651_010001 [Populus alba x Populus x berolinensis]|nr:hypothetical protein NC651_010001 [Populus alba x Populus x berolinensis]
MLLQPSKPTFQYWLLLLVSVGVWISSTCRGRHFHETKHMEILLLAVVFLSFAVQVCCHWSACESVTFSGSILF